MIVRFWVLASIALMALAWVLMVPLSPPSFQGSPRSSVAEYRAAGLVPKPGEMTISTAVGHDVFEVPETDAAHAGEEAAAGAMPDMPGMGPTPGMVGDAPAATGTPEAGVAGTMPEAPGMAGMPGMSGGAAESEGGHGETSAGLRVVDGMMAHMAARTVEIEMREWGFSPPAITIAAGEVVKLVVRNAGNVPHEFMLMPPQGMGAVAYRLERADWNLTEHEAIFERQIVMPGDSFEVAVQTDQPGNWMYMCMFPFHMQFGMMGSLATEGAAPMGGMKM